MSNSKKPFVLKTYFFTRQVLKKGFLLFKRFYMTDITGAPIS